MSVISALHTFAGWFEKEWSALYKEQPKIDKILAATLKYVGPALQLVVTAEAGAPAGVFVGKVIGDAQAGLAAASGLVYDFGPSPTVGGVISSVNANLSGLLAADHITNPTSVANVTKIVSELAALEAALATPSTAAPAPAV